jgi:hypothetical protein
MDTYQLTTHARTLWGRMFSGERLPRGAMVKPGGESWTPYEAIHVEVPCLVVSVNYLDHPQLDEILAHGLVHLRGFLRHDHEFRACLHRVRSRCGWNEYDDPGYALCGPMDLRKRLPERERLRLPVTTLLNEMARRGHIDQYESIIRRIIAAMEKEN